MAAQEEDFLALLIASERVQGWLDVIRDGHANPVRLRQAVKELGEALQLEAYAEEARRSGAVPLLTRLLKVTEDELLLNHVSDALAACSGLMATSGKVRTFHYGGIPLVLKEGALGDGVGAKVWTVAHTLCREMVRHPEIVAGCSVLEIGSGCGACGILAAKLGATRVLLTDYVDAVLRNLRDCVHLNSGSADCEAGAGEAAPAAGAGAGRADTSTLAPHPDDARYGSAGDEWDPEDASECSSSEFDAVLAEAAGGGGGSTGGGSAAAWDAPPMHVRFYDWQHSYDRLSERDRAELAGVPGIAEGVAAAAAPGATIDTPGNECGAPGMPADERFDVVLGTDILYEWPMVLYVPAVVKRRLRPAGRALLCCAVREQAMYDAFAQALRALGMRASITPVQPQADDAGWLDIRQDYEGGYVLVAIEHGDAPAQDWHRPDLFAA